MSFAFQRFDRPKLFPRFPRPPRALPLPPLHPVPPNCGCPPGFKLGQYDLDDEELAHLQTKGWLCYQGSKTVGPDAARYCLDVQKPICRTIPHFPAGSASMTLRAPTPRRWPFRGYGQGDPSLMPDAYEHPDARIPMPPPPPGISYPPRAPGLAPAPALPGDVLVPGTPPNGGAGLPTRTPPNGRGRTEPPEDKPGTGDKVKSWWAARSKVEKGAIAVGGAAGVGLIIWAIAR